MNKLKLLNKLDELENKGLVSLIKWDGERESNKKTIIISEHSKGIFIRRDSDNIWESLEEMLAELTEKHNIHF